ncbi:hypothetical protein D3C71_1965020 [compost metagenome]
MGNLQLDNRDDLECSIADLSRYRLLGNNGCAKIKLDHPLHFLAARQLHDNLRLNTVPGQYIIDKSAADRIRREQNKRCGAERFNARCFHLGQRMPW